jgi:trigger factor
MDQEQSEATKVEVPEFKSDKVAFKVHRKPACRVEFEVEVSVSIVKDAHQKAAKWVGKGVTLPGFRKGKAPETMILKNFGIQVDKKWQELIAEESFRQCQKLAQIPVLNREFRITFNTKSHSLESGASMMLYFETEPQVPHVNPEELELKPVEKPVVDEEKINGTIRQIQMFFGQWKKVTDRPIQEGDFVMLDVDGIDQDPPERLFSNTPFEVTDRSMAKWMKKLIIGQKVGDLVDGVSVPDDTASEEEKKEFKPKKVRITITVAEEAILPPVNDDLARQVGAPSVEAMKHSIEQLLHKRAQDYAQEKQREQVTVLLMDKYRFDVPMTLLDKETRFRMREMLKAGDFQKNWTQMTDEARKNTVASIADQAEKAIRMFYLCRQVLADAGITISANDVSAAPSNPLESLLSPKRENHPQDQSEMHKVEAYSRLLLEKAEDYLISKAKTAN